MKWIFEANQYSPNIIYGYEDNIPLWPTAVKPCQLLLWLLCMQNRAEHFLDQSKCWIVDKAVDTSSGSWLPFVSDENFCMENLFLGYLTTGTEFLFSGYTKSYSKSTLTNKTHHLLYFTRQELVLLHRINSRLETSGDSWRGKAVESSASER